MENETVSGIYEVIESQRKHIKDILSTLTNDAVNWNPQAGKNSIANLIEHITGAEAFWIQEVIMGQDINRVRDKEFEYRYRSKKELRTAYEYLVKSTKDILLSKLTDSVLHEKRKARTREITVLQVLLHVVEHNYYHIGQINYIKGLLKGDTFLERPKNIEITNGSE
ncbi:MAG: DinB family protein [Candidatus Thorarchaeota archaeon]